jgi:hypothetical protein
MVKKLSWLLGLWAASVLVTAAAAFAMRALLPH